MSTEGSKENQHPIFACILARAPGNAVEIQKQVEKNKEAGIVAAIKEPDELLIIVRVDNPDELGHFLVDKLQIAPIEETTTIILVGDFNPVNWLSKSKPE